MTTASWARPRRARGSRTPGPKLRRRCGGWWHPGAVGPLSRTDAAVPSRPVSLVPVPLRRPREQSVSIGGYSNLSPRRADRSNRQPQDPTGRLASTLQLARTAPGKTVCLFKRSQWRHRQFCLRRLVPDNFRARTRLLTPRYPGPGTGRPSVELARWEVSCAAGVRDDPCWSVIPVADVTVTATRCRRLRRAKHGCQGSELRERRLGHEKGPRGALLMPLWGWAASCPSLRGFLRRG